MNNRFPKIHLIYDRYKKAGPTRKAAVEIVVSYNYSQKYISTGVWLYPNQWDKGNIVNCEDVMQISSALDTLMSNVRQVLLEMIQEGNIDLGLIQERLDRKKQEKMTFLDFCKQRAVIRKYGKEKDTQERYDRFLRMFSRWGKIKSFEDVRDEKIIAYDKYLASTGMKPYSKWNNYHRFLDSFIRDAVSDGLLQRNPYNWINIDRKKQSYGLDKCLTLEEFRKLKEAKMPTESLEKVRDVFVFQTYTCLRYSDLARFNIDDITTINGMTVYKFCQKKTRKPTVIPLLPPALDILRKYDNKLPLTSNVKYNEYLKVVAQAAGLDYKISTHWARHTGATILLNEGVDMGVVAKICGHSSIKITEQIYAKLLDETVVDAVYKLKI